MAVDETWHFRSSYHSAKEQRKRYEETLFLKSRILGIVITFWIGHKRTTQWPNRNERVYSLQIVTVFLEQRLTD
jgi:hypothetical protein